MSHATAQAPEPTALTAVELARQLAAGELTAEAVTAAFITRIAALDSAGPTLRSVLEVNPDALAIARALDEQFARAGAVGPLHGVPVLVKGNIDTADQMATSAGSLALANHRAASDAVVVARLRAAGAVLLGKTNLSEWANFRSPRSVSGWSSVGGQTRNPYVLDRNPCGSSSGSAVAVAARLAPLALGTETDGSIVCPAGANGVVGVKPTIGRVSQAGIVPIAASQDTAGPLARTVADAGLLLGVLFDPDRAARARTARTSSARTPLEGLRVGVVRDYAGAGGEPSVDVALGTVLRHLVAAGAVVIDSLQVGIDPSLRAAEFEVLLYEFKAGIESYLAEASSGPRSLADLIDFNATNAYVVMPHFGQELLIAAAAKGSLDEPQYQRARTASRDWMRAALDAIFTAQALDALVAPANGRAWTTDFSAGDRIRVSSSSLAAVSGYPSVAVPAVLASQLPLGVALIGRPDTEDLLLAIAAELERQRGSFPAPRFLPTLGDGVP